MTPELSPTVNGLGPAKSGPSETGDRESGRGAPTPVRRVGRYALFDVVGHGGTATVHIGRLLGPAGFAKTVAVKRMHENVARDAEVGAMFLDEARLSARVRHPNVVATTDLLAMDGETFLIMEYVHGESLAVLSEILRSRAERMPPAIAVHILREVLLGLHAAHETSDGFGQSLYLVHRDVSPQNIQVGVDGSARVLDFGIAKALGRLQDTHTGQVKGKISYMAPEQLLGQPFDRRVDVFAAGVVLWEALAGRRLFGGDHPGLVVQRILSEQVPPLSSVVPGLSPELVQVVARATERDAKQRFMSAFEFAHALEHVTELITARAVGEWVRSVGGERLEKRAERVRQIEAMQLVDRFEYELEEATPAPLTLLGPDELTRSEIHEGLPTGPHAPLPPGVPDRSAGHASPGPHPTPRVGLPVVDASEPELPVKTRPRWAVPALLVASGLGAFFLVRALNHESLDPAVVPQVQVSAAQAQVEPVATPPIKAQAPVQLEPAEARSTFHAPELQPAVPAGVRAHASPPRAAKRARGQRAQAARVAAAKASNKVVSNQLTNKPQTPRRAEDLFSRE
jgi:hypothetical protein